MRLVFAAAAVLACAGVACSLLLDDDGFSTPPSADASTPREDASGTEASVAPDGGSEAGLVDDIGNGTGKLGPLVVNGESMINTHAALGVDAPAGSTVLSTDDVPAGWQATDVVLIWSTTGLPALPSGPSATTDLASTTAGRYELARIAKIEAGGATATITIDRPLANSYRFVATQVIRVPEHVDVTIGPTGSLRTAAWDGRRGGIVAFLATGTVQVEGVIDVDGRGFRGGRGHRNNDLSACPNLDGFPRDGYAAKGEGLSPAAYMPAPDAGDDKGGRGAVANGGGGGNCHNAGGGGGGNGGTGGKGGRTYVSSGNADLGGFGGGAIVGSLRERLVLGGGGGAGDSENTGGEITCPGAPGGGAIFIRATTIVAPGTISANGASGSAGNSNGGGGGGGGGSIALFATARVACGSVLRANGGDGSTLSGTGQGPGGGGGGGTVLLAAPMLECTPSVAPGKAGTNKGSPDAGFDQYFGATSGLVGKVVSEP